VLQRCSLEARSKRLRAVIDLKILVSTSVFSNDSSIEVISIRQLKVGKWFVRRI